MDTVKEEINDLSRIGLDKEKSEELADKLNNLLANYSLFYQNRPPVTMPMRIAPFFTLLDSSS